MTGMIRAPFSDSQVKAFTAWQENPNVHPYTCPGLRGCGDRRLRMTHDGLVCPCGKYRQDWIHGGVKPRAQEEFDMGDGGGSIVARTGELILNGDGAILGKLGRDLPLQGRSIYVSILDREGEREIERCLHLHRVPMPGGGSAWACYDPTVTKELILKCDFVEAA